MIIKKKQSIEDLLKKAYKENNDFNFFGGKIFYKIR